METELHNPSYLYMAAKSDCVSGALQLLEDEYILACGLVREGEVCFPKRMHPQIFIDTGWGSWDSAEDEKTKLALTRKYSSMDKEKDLIDAFDAMVHTDFANPERIGCPGHDSLVKLASGPANPELARVLAHIRQCAPCFDELKQLRRTEDKSHT